MRSTGSREALTALAGLYGVQTSYREWTGRRKRGSRDAVLAALGALGAPIEEGLEEALRHRRHQLESRVVEPVAVAWDGGPVAIPLRPPASVADARLSGVLELETGEERRFPLVVSELPVAGSARSIVFPGPIPFGYHQLHLEELGSTTLIVSAPRRAPGWGRADVWGVFLPLYALRSERSWGVGDLTDLEALMGWIGSLGGRLIATLPLLAAFHEELSEPSPYSPASRLFWNELHVDVSRIPELAACREARDAIGSNGVRNEIRALQRLGRVDHPRAMALKRSVLELLASSFFAGGEPARRQAFRAFASSKPDLRDYARFRAAGERRRLPWFEWPAPDRDGTIADGVVDPHAVRYHEYVQWIADEQMTSVLGSARGSGMGLYLDLPVGVNRSGFDVWREREAFALRASAGAPTDPFAVEGQDWGFPPLHPERIREQGYRYVIASLRHLFRRADVVRVDHVLGFRRLFWIPSGFAARDGLYVRYPMEELFAIVTLEAHREGVVIVGEDLGTDPRPVRAAMARHGWHRTYVLQERFGDDPDGAFSDIPSAAVVSPNTHDTPPFAAFWDALSAERREMLAARAGAARGADGLGVLEACLRALASSRGRAFVLNLEDLWGETRPQNVPGTAGGNWQRKARYPLERFRRMPEVVGTLSAVNDARTERSSR
jgi:4-alpha-glucanotransferase